MNKFEFPKEEILHDLAILVTDCPVLTKEPADGDLEESSVLRVNKAFAAKIDKNFVKVNKTKKKDDVNTFYLRNKRSESLTRNCSKRRKHSSKPSS